MHSISHEINQAALHGNTSFLSDSCVCGFILWVYFVCKCRDFVSVLVFIWKKKDVSINLSALNRTISRWALLWPSVELFFSLFFLFFIQMTYFVRFFLAFWSMAFLRLIQNCMNFFILMFREKKMQQKCVVINNDSLKCLKSE